MATTTDTSAEAIDGELSVKPLLTASQAIPSAALDSVWQQQSRWSQAADGLKRDIERRRLIALGCTIAGALLSGAAVMAGLASTGGQVFAFAGAAAVGLAGLTRSRGGRDDLRRLTRARSVAEAIKSEVYAHLALGACGTQALDQRVAELQDDAADLLPLAVAAQPVQRALPEVHDVESYLRVRVGGQVDHYYRPRATHWRRGCRRSDAFRPFLRARASSWVRRPPPGAAWQSRSGYR